MSALFMIKRKKYRFQVNFELDELSSFTFVSGIIFAKIRLLDGGSFSEFSPREEVVDHCVKWGTKFQFECKMTANPSTGVLQPCMLRVSVRREVKGGQKSEKLGFAEINLAEFAGSSSTTRLYLLEGYDSAFKGMKHRQDNSTLKVSIGLHLKTGDPCFKTPGSYHNQVPLPGEDDSEPHGRVPNREPSNSSVASGSSGFGSLPRKEKEKPDAETPEQEDSKVKEFVVEEERFERREKDFGHSRNSSYASQQSRGSGYSSVHSRQNSYGTDPFGHTSRTITIIGESSKVSYELQLPRSPSAGSGVVDCGRRRKLDSDSTKERVDSTRPVAEQLVDDLIKTLDEKPVADSESRVDLQLFIGKGGVTAVGNSGMVQDMQPVVIAKPKR
ncbi:EEIG family member 2-like isoform X2 [Tubulanus polymorphus]|uniref:EEIG family member 2-like isoform X2 n=1 Tax=Tubulanus polymorphus TaxID=672921 RepID=UPI003DA66C23